MKSPYLPTGQIVNTHGLKGYVKIQPWADDPADLLDFDRFLSTAGNMKWSRPASKSPWCS